MPKQEEQVGKEPEIVPSPESAEKIQKYWDEVMNCFNFGDMPNDPYGAEGLLFKREDFRKMLHEEDVMEWLDKEFAKVGLSPRVELVDGVIKPKNREM